MRKSLFILAALLLPMTLSAQSALQQLEQMAGMSIHDVHVPDPGDPVPVDPDPEEDSQPQQSTHLKDYTPAQETTQPAPKQEPKPLTYEERQQQWREAEQRRLNKEDEAIRNSMREDREREEWRYNYFLETRPRVQTTPVFSGISERKYVFDTPKSLYELSNDYGEFLIEKKDSDYKADMLRIPQQAYPGARFLGRRLPNGRTEWRIFYQDRIRTGKMGYREDYGWLGFPAGFDYRKIWDVKFAGEGRIVLLEMNNGDTYVLKGKDGSVICKGRNISCPVMSNENNGVVFIECDGKLYASNMPKFSLPILQGDHFDYYGRTVIVTHHNSAGETSYTMCTYGGRQYDYKQHKWTKHSSDAAYDFVAPFRNDGDYYVIKPQGKNYYQIVAYSHHDHLFQGKKKYKTLEDAHAGWVKEKKYFYEMFMYKPEKGADSE